MKGFKTPLALLMVILALGGLAYWDETKTGSDKKLAEVKSRLFDFRPEDIVQVSVKNINSQPIEWVLKKEAGNWKVMSPLVYPGDGSGIDRFLKILADANFERTFDVGEKGLEGYALDSPLVSYEFSDKAGKSWRFEVGGKSPTGYSSYVKTNSDVHIYLVNQYLYTATNKSLSDFRDRTLFIPLAKDVETAEINWPQMPAIKVVRAKEGEGKDWQMVTPLATKADATEMNKYLSGWERIRVLEFIDSPPPALRQALTERSQGTKEYVRASFQGKGNALREVQILENDGKLYVKLADETFAEVDKHQIDDLRKSANDLQDRTLFAFLSADVTELTIDGKVYSKTKGEWFEQSNQKPADFAQGIVLSLEFAKADVKLTAAEGVSLSQGTALHTVEIKEKDKAPTQFSLWSRSPDGQQLLLRTGDRYYGVSAEFMDILKPKASSTSPTLGGELKGEKS